MLSKLELTRLKIFDTLILQSSVIQSNNKPYFKFSTFFDKYFYLHQNKKIKKSKKM